MNWFQRIVSIYVVVYMLASMNIIFLFIFLALPSEPSHLRLVGITESSVTIEWTKPKFDGGQPIKGYIIEYREGKSTVWMVVNKVSASELTCKIPSLKEGVLYAFRVAAFTEEGTGPFTEISESIRVSRPRSMYSSFCVGL